jgi:lipopolysaccharide export system protein LptA
MATMSRASLLRTALTAFVGVFASIASAQSDANGDRDRVRIQNADTWEYDDAIAPGAQRLKGSVKFAHGDAILRCDSAYLYEDQRIDAFGHVSIDQGDSLHMEGERLVYQGKDRRARIEGNVRLRDKGMELSTPALDYDLRAKRGSYDQGGNIISRKDGSTLSSDIGVYLADSRQFQFSRNVHSEHPERTIRCDTMHYGTATSMVRFFGPSTIDLHKDSTVIRTTRGSYDMTNDRARFSQRSSVLSRGKLLEGDSLHYDKKSGLGKAWGHVILSDTASDVLARGDHGTYEERSERSIITGHAEMVLLMDADSLFLHGDSLIARPEEDGSGRHITARSGVRFFKSDLQGICDTLVYSGSDSLIRMYHQPVLWTGDDQISGTHIRIALANGGIERLFVEGDAFLMSQVDSVHYDQVTGTTMTGFFANSSLERLIAEGNSRTVYFAVEDSADTKVISAVNRADCSRIAVTLKDGEANSVTFLERPDALLYPLDKVPPEELRMSGSAWRSPERPRDRSDIFVQEPSTPIKE